MRTTGLVFILILLITLSSGVSYAQVNIVVNKGSFATVQQASVGEAMVNYSDNDQSDDRACTESFAATELARFLPEATTIKAGEIKFSEQNTLPKTGTVFIIGSRFTNSLIRKFDLTGKSNLTILTTEQSYNIRSFRDNERIVTIIEGADRIGTLYGVYRYLEEFGVKFIGLGQKGTILPGSPVDIPSNLNIIENPSYTTRGFYTWNDRKTSEEFFLWMARNKLNYWTAQGQPVKLLKKLGVKLGDGGHRFQGFVFNSNEEYPYNHPVFKDDENKPDDPYKVGNDYTGDTDNDGKLSNFEAHPEWYGMKNGKRTEIVPDPKNASQSGINFCTSNADARAEFAKRIAQQLTDGKMQFVDVFEFWMFDGGKNTWCTCEKCNGAGSYTDKLFMVTYDILKELEHVHQAGKLNRRVEVSTIAYTATLDPPTVPLPADFDYENSSITFFPILRCYVHSFADPECTEINQWLLKSYQGWSMGERRYYKGSIFIGEYYNVSSIRSQPVLFPKIMSVDIPWYYRNGARQFHYMHTPDTLWGTWTLNQYLMGKLLWNVNVDVNYTVDDYFNNYYPTTCNSTRKFYGQLEVATANIKVLKHNVEIGNGKTYSLAGRLLRGDLFQLDHMHYDEYHPLLNDGPDVVEMIDAMDLAKKYLDISLMDCKDPLEQQRLLEDKNRFDYGYAMYRYIYHMIRTSVFHEKSDKTMAGREFAIVEKYAEQLRKVVDLVQVASDDANSPNGFEATGSSGAFNEFKKLYGN
jgi:hypothetical protein